VVADRGSLGQFAAQFGSLDVRWAAVALVLMAAVDFAKALRWQVLYGQLRPSYRRVLQAQVVGQAANTLVPLRLGEVLRVSWAAPTPSGVARGTAGLVLTKAVDAVVLAGLIAWVFGGSLLAQAQLMPAVGLGLLVAVGLGLAQRYRHIGGGGLGAIRPLLSGAARYARELHAGTLAIVVTTSAFGWIVGGVANLAVLAAVGAPPSIDAAGRILASGYVAGLLPAPPGRLGVFEGAVAAALVAGGMDLSMAVAVAVVLHALQLLEVGLLVPVATRWR
jgi:glycosyltransferase 2 family protein